MQGIFLKTTFPKTNEQPQQIFNNLQDMSIKDIITELKRKKDCMIKSELIIQKNVTAYYQELAAKIQLVSESTINKVSLQMLSFYQQLEAAYQKMGHLLAKPDQMGKPNQNEHSISYGADMSKIIKLLSFSLHQKVNILPCHFEEGLANFYQIYTSEEEAQDQLNNTSFLNDFELLTAKKNEREKKQMNPEMVIIEKLEEKIERHLINEEKLKNKLKYLEGSALKKNLMRSNTKCQNNVIKPQFEEQKVSRWRIKRVQQENKSLLAEITSCSSKMLELQGQNSALRYQLKKYVSNVSITYQELTNRSMMASLHYQNSKSNKQESYQNLLPENDSSKILMDSDYEVPGTVKQRVGKDQPSEVRKDHQFKAGDQKQQYLEVKSKYQELLCGTTHQIKEINVLNEEKKLLESALELQSKEIESLTFINLTLNRDYQINLKKKCILEEENAKIKHENKELHQLQGNMKAELNGVKAEIQSLSEEKRRYERLLKEEGQRYRQLQVYSMQRDQQVQHMTVAKIQLQRVQIKLQQQVNQLKSTGAEEGNWKVYLNEEINKLQKQLNTINKQLYQSEEANYELTAKNKILSQTENQLKSKVEQFKKEHLKYKRQNKELACDLALHQKRIEERLLQERKIIEMEQNIAMLRAQFIRCKENSEQRYLINQSRITIMKERFHHQISTLVEESSEKSAKSINKGKNILEVIQKYTESLSNNSSKIAQIKQLKEQLKEAKGSSICKKNKSMESLHTNSANCYVETELFHLSAKIMEERITTEKQLCSEKVKEYQDIIQKEEQLRKLLEHQLIQEKSVNAEFKHKIKIQSQSNKEENCQMVKNQKKFQERHEKMENQLKSIKAMLKKCQNQLSQCQLQVKSKKQLALNLKKQLKQKEEEAKQLLEKLDTNDEEVEKLKRLNKQILKKQVMYKDLKEKMMEMQCENEAFRRSSEISQQKIRGLNWQLSKKDESIKQIRNQEQKESSKKEEVKSKQLTQKLNELREQIKKLKAEIDRKDNLLLHNKKKYQARAFQFEENATNRESDLERIRNQHENIQKKYQNLRISFKKEESKSCLYGLTLKRLFELFFMNGPEQREDKEIRFSKASGTKESLKNISGITNFSPNLVKSQIQCFESNASKSPFNGMQGLEILQISGQEFHNVMTQQLNSSTIQVNATTNQVNATTSQNGGTIQNNSKQQVYGILQRNQIKKTQHSEFLSPMINKHHNNSKMKEVELLGGIEELEKMLKETDLNVNQIVNHFQKLVPK